MVQMLARGLCICSSIHISWAVSPKHPDVVTIAPEGHSDIREAEEKHQTNRRFIRNEANPDGAWNKNTGDRGPGAPAASVASAPAADKPIPDLIFFTGLWDPNEVVQNNKDFVPGGTEFRFYNNTHVDAAARRISYLLDSEVGLKGAYEAYSSLRPWAYRADLWRLMVLWAHGGIYIDAKYVFAQPTASWVDQYNDSFALCWDTRDLDKTGKANGPDELRYFNAILAARPRQQSVLEVLRHIINNVKSRFYGNRKDAHNDLYITGPGALTTAVNQLPAKPRADCELVAGLAKVRGFEVDQRIVKKGTEITLMGSVMSVHQQQRTCPTCHSYSELYKQHAVYCDEKLGTPWTDDPCKSSTVLKPDVKVVSATIATTLVEEEPPELEYWSRVV